MLLYIWNKLSKVSPVKHIGFFALLAFLTAFGINYALNFDGIDFNGDSHLYFRMAKHFKHALLNFVVPDRMHWPYGYPALVSLPLFFAGETFKAAQWVNFIAGAGFVAVCGSLVLKIAQYIQLEHKKTVLLVFCSMLLLLGKGTILKYQLLIMSDMTAIFWSVLMTLLVWQWKMTHRNVFLFAGGILLGIAFSTRPVYLLMVFPLTAIAFSDFTWRNFRNVVMFSGAGFIIGILPQMIITGSGQTPDVGYELLTGWNPKNFFSLTFDSIDGHQSSRIPSFIYYFILPFRFEDYTPFGLVLACYGAYYGLKELPRWVCMYLLLWYLAFYILLCGIPIQNPRIAFSMYPPLLLFMSFGVLKCLQRWRASIVITGVMLLAIVSVTFSFRYIKKFVKSKNELKQTAEHVATITEKNSRVISTSLYAVYLAYPSDVTSLSMYALSIPQAETILKDRTKTFLAIDHGRFDTQWGSYPAGKTYYWIKNNYTCIPVQQVGEFTVYEIKP